MNGCEAHRARGLWTCLWRKFEVERERNRLQQPAQAQPNAISAEFQSLLTLPDFHQIQLWPAPLLTKGIPRSKSIIQGHLGNQVIIILNAAHISTSSKSINIISLGLPTMKSPSQSKAGEFTRRLSTRSVINTSSTHHLHLPTLDQHPVSPGIGRLRSNRAIKYADQRNETYYDEQEGPANLDDDDGNLSSEPMDNFFCWEEEDTLFTDLMDEQYFLAFADLITFVTDIYVYPLYQPRSRRHTF